MSAITDRWEHVTDVNWVLPGYYGQVGSRIFFLCASEMGEAAAQKVLICVPGATLFGLVTRPDDIPSGIVKTDTSGLAD